MQYTPTQYKVEIQKIFNKTVLHARKQRKVAMADIPGHDGPICAYRTLDGLACFAGCHVKDAAYRKDMEGLSAKSDTVESILYLSGIDSNFVDFIQELQMIHDNNDPPYWEGEFRRLADTYCLSIPEPTDALPLL